MQEMTYKRIDITLDPIVLKRLDNLAKHQGMSRSATIAQLINEATSPTQ